MPDSPYPRLSGAPIVEAVIELKVRTRGTVDEACFTAVSERLQHSLPVRSGLKFLQSHFTINAETGESSSQTESSIGGTRLESEDGHTVVLARPDGVSISHVTVAHGHRKPYDSWGPLRDQAKEVWAVYASEIALEIVIRLGVRYINRIELPDKPIDFDEVLTSGPKIPTGFPPVFSEFFSRIVVFSGREKVAIIQAYEQAPPPPLAGSARILVDIDAFVDRPWGIKDPAIWEELERLRDAKNKAFFGSLTPTFLETLK